MLHGARAKGSALFHIIQTNRQVPRRWIWCLVLAFLQSILTGLGICLVYLIFFDIFTFPDISSMASEASYTSSECTALLVARNHHERIIQQLKQMEARLTTRLAREGDTTAFWYGAAFGCALSIFAFGMSKMAMRHFSSIGGWQLSLESTSDHRSNLEMYHLRITHMRWELDDSDQSTNRSQEKRRRAKSAHVHAVANIPHICSCFSFSWRFCLAAWRAILFYKAVCVNAFVFLVTSELEQWLCAGVVTMGASTWYIERSGSCWSSFVGAHAPYQHTYPGSQLHKLSGCEIPSSEQTSGRSMDCWYPLFRRLVISWSSGRIPPKNLCMPEVRTSLLSLNHCCRTWSISTATRALCW